MKNNIIRYVFCDGTVSEHEVPEDLFAVHTEMVQAEKRLFWREAKWKVSKEFLEEYAEQNAASHKVARNNPRNHTYN